MFKKNRIWLVVSALVATAVLLGADLGFKPQWVEANYDDLVERAQLTQSGRSVGEVLRTFDGSRHDQAELQYFLDRFAGMLDDVVAAERPDTATGYAPVCDSFPAGSAQPAWAALVRSGAMHISSDGKGRVRLYLPVKNTKGTADAAAAYKAKYSVLRHPLAWLADKNPGKPLSVEVFCFNNDYARRSLHLSMRTHSFTEAVFASGASQPLNLAEIRDFMRLAPRVDGARLSGGSLILVGEKSSQQTLDGTPLSIADLAIAYRACAHSGPNEPFVSLDPHAQPTKVTVSLGGYLEDTRIGTVLLEADKRFKSLSTGLSPDGIADIASTVQARVPTFITTDQRRFASPIMGSGWRGTRFWFYPDSIVVESNLSGTVAAVVSPRFTADAERSEEDVRKLGAKMESAKALLAPETKESIAEFNQDYDQLRGSFNELSELDVVGRIMGLCAWSKRSLSRSQIDWDALLGVELPAYRTPRDKYQLISSSHLVESGESPAVSRKIVRHSFTRMLSVRFSEFAFTDEEMKKLRDGSASPPWDVRLSTTGVWTGTDAARPIGELLSSESLVQNFASLMSKRAQRNPRQAELQSGLDVIKAEMAELDADISRIKGEMNILERAQKYDEYNALVRKVNASIKARRELTDKYNQGVRAYNSLPQVAKSIVHIGGGISVRPESFTIRDVPTSSAVVRIEDLSSRTTDSAGIVRSGPAGSATSPKPGVSAVLPPTVADRVPTPAGKGYYSVSAAGAASEHLVSSDDGSVTSVRFAADGGQAATKLERQPSTDGVPRYKFSRLQGQRFIKPTAAEPAR
jgi:hypothetical protein